VCSKVCLTPPTLLEMGIFHQLSPPQKNPLQSVFQISEAERKPGVVNIELVHHCCCSAVPGESLASSCLDARDLCIASLQGDCAPGTPHKTGATAEWRSTHIVTYSTTWLCVAEVLELKFVSPP
jgi:hypothetical protein